MSNGNCRFSTTLTYSDGNPIDSTLFKYTSEVLTPRIINTLFDSKEPTLAISTNNGSREGIYDFTLKVTSLAVPSDNVVELFNFSIELIDNPCVRGISGIP